MRMIGAAIAVVVTLTAATTAEANTLLQVDGTTGLTAVACASSRICVVAGSATGGGTAFAKVTTSSETGPSVGAVHAIPGITSVTGISCPTRSICEAVGFDESLAPAIAPIDITTNTVGATVPVPSTSELFSIDCPAISACEAVGYGLANYGVYLQVAVAADGTPTLGAVQPDTDVAALYDIDCPTSGICWAVGPAIGGGAVVRIHAKTDAADLAQFSDGTIGLAGIACTGTADCVAVGYGGHNGSQGEVASVVNGTLGAGEVDSHVGEIGDVACPYAATCEGVTFTNAVIPLDHGLPPEGKTPVVAGTSGLNAIACPTATTCDRVGGDGTTGVVAYQGPVVDSNPNFPDAAPCPTAGPTSEVPFSAASAILSNSGFGGVYATISQAPVCRDPNASPPTSSWVMLQVPTPIESNCSAVGSLCFAQAGVYYDKDGPDHPFVEFNYRGFQTLQPSNDPALETGNAIEFKGMSVPDPASFGVLVQGVTATWTNCQWVIDAGKLTAYKKYQGKVPGGGNSTLQLEATINGNCLWIFYLPAKIPNGNPTADNLQWAHLAGEGGSNVSRTPGTYNTPLGFTDAHVYYLNGWQNFLSDYSGSTGNPRRASAASLLYPNIQPAQGARICHLAPPRGGADWAFYTWTQNQAHACNPWAN